VQQVTLMEEGGASARPWWYSYGMVVVTAITNFATLPTILLLLRRKKYLESFAGVFTLVYYMLSLCPIIDLFAIAELHLCIITVTL
jgi:hypothetical protein